MISPPAPRVVVVSNSYLFFFFFAFKISRRAYLKEEKIGFKTRVIAVEPDAHVTKNSTSLRRFKFRRHRNDIKINIFFFLRIANSTRIVVCCTVYAGRVFYYTYCRVLRRCDDYGSSPRKNEKKKYLYITRKSVFIEFIAAEKSVYRAEKRKTLVSLENLRRGRFEKKKKMIRRVVAGS